MDRHRRAVEIVALLRVLGHEAALVGGLAVSARSRERFTQDVDFAVAVASDDESEALAVSMQRAGFRLAQVIEQVDRGIVATLRFVDPLQRPDAPSLDLLCGSSGIEPEIVAESERIELLPGVALPVARVPHLIAMKVLSESEVRLQDRVDLQALFAVADGADLAGTRVLLRLITARGFDRGRDLEPHLDHLLTSLRPGVAP